MPYGELDPTEEYVIKKSTVYASERNSHDYSFIIHKKKLNSQRIVHSYKLAKLDKK